MGGRKSKSPVAKRSSIPIESAPSPAQAELQAEVAAAAKQLFRQHPPQMLGSEHEQRIELGLMLDVAIEVLQQVYPGTSAEEWDRALLDQVTLRSAEADPVLFAGLAAGDRNLMQALVRKSELPNIQAAIAQRQAKGMPF